MQRSRPIPYEIPSVQVSSSFLRSMLLAAVLCLFTLPATVLAQSALDVLHYTATIRFDIAGRRIDGSATLSLHNASPSNLATVTLHLRDLAVTSVLAGGSTALYSQQNGELSITLPSPISPGDSIDLAIGYNGSPTPEAGSGAWGGCFWGSTSYVLGVGFHAPYVSMMRHWLPSNDIPSDKASFDLTYVVPDGYVAAGTGTLTEVSSQNGMTSYRWVETFPTATYLVTYAISHFARIREQHSGLPYEYFVSTKDSGRAVTHFSTVPGMVAAFEKAYGPYPFDKVGYCVTPTGSMEHQTMISYAASVFQGAFASGLAAHELAHQWWGDCVTPTDFRDAWLSEGFATFSEAVYNEHLGGSEAYLQRARQFSQAYFNAERYEGTFSLYDFPRASPSSNYPSTIYDKGAAVLVMLRHVLGDSAFFEGMREYRSRFEYANAGSRDFQHAMEVHSAKPLDWFFNEWVFKPGYPRYTISTSTTRDGQPFRIWIAQNTTDTAKYPLFTMPLDLWIITTTGDTLRQVVESHGFPNELFTFPGVPDSTVSRYLVDPLGIVLKTLTTSVLNAGDIPVPEALILRVKPQYPNPISVGTGTRATIPFELTAASHVMMVVYDSLGRPIRTCSDGLLGRGHHQFSFDADGLPSGTYLLQIIAGTQSMVFNCVVTH